MQRSAWQSSCAHLWAVVCWLGMAGTTATVTAADEDVVPLPGTAPLTLAGDIASQMVEGIDRFLLAETARAPQQRAKYWRRDFSSAEAYQNSIEPNRRRLAFILGVRDPLHRPDVLELLADTDLLAAGQLGPAEAPGAIAANEHVRVYAVRWPAFGDVCGEGLLLEPTKAPLANVVAIPDADHTPEMIAGLVPGVPPQSQYARRLAESGCRVVVPALVNRQVEKRRNVRLTNREWVYRPAFEMGRHVIGYQLQQVLALVDWMASAGARVPAAAAAPATGQTGADVRLKIGVIGWGEGGLLALYAGALEPRIEAVCTSGYFDSRQDLWQEPLDRNVFGLLEQFGDAEVASMIAPRGLVVEACRGPEITVPPGTGGGPGRLITPPLQRVRDEFNRAQQLVAQLQPAPLWQLVETPEGTGHFASAAALKAFCKTIAPAAALGEPGQPLKLYRSAEEIARLSAARHGRLLHQLDRHTQWLLAESPYIREEFFKKLDRSSLEKFLQTIEPYREYFREEVIGRFDRPLLPPNPRSRKAYDTPKWTGYEVVLDVFPEVIAYGILLLPKDIKPGERRPVVVCQHGLEGRPQQVVSGGHRSYHDFAAKLAERGFITFAPQNPYIFGDRFRSLQRKANPLKRTLFSVIVPQHQQIVDWLASLPQVDPQRIAFYGLSYGGKTAMRVPPLVKNYCLSICSADFNDWIWKNVSTRAPYSYVWTGEYEIFEFDLGNTFNYAEMAALIAPRPFMVERGHFDGVAPDETVAYEFAKVRHLYQARLGIGDRCRIEWFVGPHTIHGVGTFEFLHEKLNWR